ncbi:MULTISPECIES: hypothetical protein [unclassified Curtobacterium]|uniref:hypothetical protein n=1 Tax=unclassified Curtobacterium TaxID=257496 RepID=UPI0038290784
MEPPVGIEPTTYSLRVPGGGTAAARAETAYIGTLYVDQMLNATTLERFQGSYTGTRTQAVGNGSLAGIGAFSAATGSSTSFISMGSDGRFTLQAGAYEIAVVMNLTGAKATGRTFVEVIDVNDSTVQTPRGNMTPNVGEDTVSTSFPFSVTSTRLFRVQAFQTSGGSQNVKFALAILKIG